MHDVDFKQKYQKVQLNQFSTIADSNDVPIGKVTKILSDFGKKRSQKYGHETCSCQRCLDSRNYVCLRSQLTLIVRDLFLQCNSLEHFSEIPQL